jgi:hypothetical protein
VGSRGIASERLRGGAGVRQAKVEGIGVQVGTSASGGGTPASVHRWREFRSPAKEKERERERERFREEFT